MSAGAPGREYQGGPDGPPWELITQLEWLEQQRRLHPIDLAPAPAGAVNASVQVINGGARALCGWAITESTGAASAAIRLRDGTNNGSRVLARINLNPGESTREFLDHHGIRIQTGLLWLEVLAGSVEGVLWVRGESVI
jgi:hypothetical protein